MGWRVFGERLDTADLSGTDKNQKIIMSEDTILVAVRTWIIFYNNPALTSLSMRLYSDTGSAAGKLLYTSASLTKAQMITLANGVKEVYFTFNSGNGVPLRGGDAYRLVLSGSGYTGDSSSHIAWMKAWPNPVYTTNVTSTFPKLAVAPYMMSLVGAGM